MGSDAWIFQSLYYSFNYYISSQARPQPNRIFQTTDMASKIGALGDHSSQSPGLRSSIQRSEVRRTNDPYELNFNHLRKEYVQDSNIRLPFVKSSFIHYAACPLNLKLGDEELKNELVLTMELVQAPKHLRQTQLTDPKMAKKQEQERKKKEKEAEKAALKKQRMEERKQKRKEEKMMRASMREQDAAEKERQKEERRAEREAQYETYVEEFEAKKKAAEEKEASKFERKIQQRQSQKGINQSDEEEEEEDDEDEEDSEAAESLGEMKTLDEFLEDLEQEEASGSSGGDSYGDYGEESVGGSEMGSGAGSGSDEDYDSEDGSGSSYGSEGMSSDSDASDREYTGDMFVKRQPIKFASGSAEAIGNLNKTLNVYEYVCFSIWRNGGNDIRYCRLRDAVIPIPPVSTDLRFRTAHSCKSVYYLGEEYAADGSKKSILVVISLQDLSYKTFDLTKTGETLTHLRNSSLIMQDSALAFQHSKSVASKKQKHLKEVSCFSVFDLEKQTITWTLEKVERLFFKAEELDQDTPIEFGKPAEEEEADGASNKSSRKPPEKIFAVRRATEVKAIEDGKEEEEAAKEGEAAAKKLSPRASTKPGGEDPKDKKGGDAEAKTETRKYYRTYEVTFGEEIDQDDESALAFECHIVVDDKVKKHGKEKKERAEEEKQAAAEERAQEIASDPASALVMATLGGGQPVQQLQLKKKKREREVVYAVDRDLEVLVILVKGQKGEQHKIFQFSTEHCEAKQTRDPFQATNRAGNTYLEFNQDWHLRDREMLFLIQTETNGTCTAKPLSFEAGAEKMPAVHLKNASKDLRKDVWVMEGNAEAADEVTVHSICKSSTDDFLQCEALDCSSFDGSPESTKKLVQRSSKIRSQEIDVNFPCLVYNIGLRQIKVQSTIAPDVCATFNLFDRDFLAFAQYRDFADVGLVDKRSSAEKNAVPFEQTGNKIAFLTRNKHGREGEIYLNVLQVDPFASPQKFELLETVYEAEMKGGIRDDCIYNAFVMQVTSVRGLDVSFVCQYNDAIIFDCITSTKQLPLRFPMPVSRRTEEETDKYFNEAEKTIEWETALDITKGAVPMKQSMQMDDSGALYFAVKTEAGLMKVLRVDPFAEMGSANFIKSVFSMRCDYIHFLTYANGYFFLMDEKKKVRRLTQDPLTFALKMDTTLEMLPQDQLTVKYSEFDEFIMSDGLMHWDDRIIFLSEQKRKDVYTWGQSKIMAENHKFIQGPKRAKGTGMVYYLEQYDGALQDDQTANPEENEVQNLLERAVTSSEFKGFSVMLKPLADLSYIDILPQFKENHNNFSSYIDQEHILVRHSGRFFVFHNEGAYCGQAAFANMEAAFKQEQLDIVCISDNMKYFAFEGPNFAAKERKEKKGKRRQSEKKEPEAKKEEAKTSGGLLGGLLSAKAQADAEEAKKKSKAQKILYVFKLEKVVSGLFAKKVTWKFVEQDMKLNWIENPETRHRTRHSIDHNGVFTMAYAESDVFAEEATLKVSIQSCASKPMEKSSAGKSGVAAPPESEKGRPSVLAALTSKAQESEEQNLEFIFHSEQRREKVSVLTRKINTIQKRKELGVADKRDDWKLNRLLDRRAHVDSAWLFTNYIVVKSGAELQYLPRRNTGLIKAKPQRFNIDFGAEVWIQDIFSTGIDDLIQIFLINDITRRLFVITWNLQLNREHSNFQTTFDDSTNPEYLLLRTYGKDNSQKFNMMLDHGALINLQTNLPVQFFDIENERDWCPDGELKKNVQGQKKVQGDGTKYLELTHPGRIQHFISYTDWTYWVRYEQSRDSHELQRGRITQISPIARFPDGISVFHTFATNVKVLDAISNYISQQKHLAANKDDARIHMLPLMFLHSDPARNQGGGKTTPLHLALDKQSPMAFEIMLSLLKTHTKVCVTSQLLDRLEDIIAQNSPVVNEFFDQSFFITDQFAGAQALDWTLEGDKDEHYVNVPSSFLTKETLQKLVQGDGGVKAEEEDVPDGIRDNNFLALLGAGDVVGGEEGPSKYSLDIEDVATDKEDTSNLRQVEAKLLEFNWIFIGQNAAKFIAVLAETENDEIFATQQVRVLIEFLWQGYYTAIRDKLFLPFVAYMATYSCYVTVLSKEHSNEFNALYCCEMACLVLAGKLGLRFLLLEAIQITRDKWAYFTDFWNLLDLCSLALNATYVAAELSNRYSENTINLIGAASIAIMWTKMFYWMRIGKSFAAFIRVVEQIVKSISVFSFMLAVVLVAFANCIMVLQLNRHAHEHESGEVPAPIFDPFTGLLPFDAIIHAYLTGLGDFNKDNYSELNGLTVWVFFLTATILVQLVFMNLLIALMGDAYGEIMAIQEQSTMKELCAMMEDHIWMLDIGEIFKHSRYILWLTPDSASQSGSAMERQINQLQEFVEDRAEQSDTKVLRELALLREDLEGIKTQLADIERNNEDDEDSY